MALQNLWFVYFTYSILINITNKQTSNSDLTISLLLVCLMLSEE